MKRRVGALTIQNATGCAWRGLYLDWRDQQFARVTLDPSARRWVADPKTGKRSFHEALLTVRLFDYTRTFAMPRSRHWWRLDGRNKGGLLGTFTKGARR